MGRLGLVLTCWLYPLRVSKRSQELHQGPLICVFNTSFFSLSGAFQMETSAEYLFSQESLSSYIVSQSKDSQCLEEYFCSERLFLIQSQGNSSSLVSLGCLLVICCFLLLGLCSYFQWKFVRYQPLCHRQQWKSYRIYFVIESIY